MNEQQAKFARCGDCVNFGHHGAHCDLFGKQVLITSSACIFCELEKGKLKPANYFCIMSLGNDYDQEERDFRGGGEIVMGKYGMEWKNAARK